MVSVCVDLEIVNGPLLGGRVVGHILVGQNWSADRRDERQRRISVNVPFGSVRMTVMSPVASSVLIADDGSGHTVNFASFVRR